VQKLHLSRLPPSKITPFLANPATLCFITVQLDSQQRQATHWVSVNTRISSKPGRRGTSYRHPLGHSRKTNRTRHRPVSMNVPARFLKAYVLPNLFIAEEALIFEPIWYYQFLGSTLETPAPRARKRRFRGEHQPMKLNQITRAGMSGSTAKSEPAHHGTPQLTRSFFMLFPNRSARRQPAHVYGHYHGVPTAPQAVSHLAWAKIHCWQSHNSAPEGLGDRTTNDHL